MKLTYLGTAAAEGWPALFCRCPACVKALELGGKNIRSRSQALINDDLLIDFPADTMWHMIQNKLDFSAIKNIIITHSHLDHFTVDDIRLRQSGVCAHNPTVEETNLYGNKAVMEVYHRFFTDVYENGKTRDNWRATGLTTHEIEAYQPFKCDKYLVSPLPARHMKHENALNYMISDGEKTILYLHDTNIPSDDVYEYLKNVGAKIDLVSYDCCNINLPSDDNKNTHMNFDANKRVREKLGSIGVLNSNAKHIVNHYSHNAMLLHDEIEALVFPHGFLASYDGMVVEI